jgi:hypothetical protein
MPSIELKTMLAFSFLTSKQKLVTFRCTPKKRTGLKPSCNRRRLQLKMWQLPCQKAGIATKKVITTLLPSWQQCQPCNAKLHSLIANWRQIPLQ